MSLNGTYESIKTLIVNNLNEMGVTASSNEGWTTLINKVLDISVGSLTLTSNKSILSYYDSETATLTATHSLGAGKTVEVYNAVTGSKIGDMTDNNDGTYSYTYNSTGNGNISMTVTSGAIESNSVTIEDMYFYDDATQNKSSNFSFMNNPVNASISWNSNNNEYVVNYSRTAESNPVQIKLCDFILRNFEISIDVYYTTTGGTKQWTSRISDNTESNDLWKNHSEVGSWSSSTILRNMINSVSSQSNPSGAILTGRYYTYKFIRNNGNILIQQLNGDNVVKQYSSSEWSTSEVKWWLQISEYVGTFKFKNLKIEAL